MKNIKENNNYIKKLSFNMIYNNKWEGQDFMKIVIVTDSKWIINFLITPVTITILLIPKTF